MKMLETLKKLISSHVFLGMTLAFALTQALGIFLRSIYVFQPVTGTQVSLSAVDFLIYFALISLIFFFLLKGTKKPLIFKGLFYIIIFQGVTLVLDQFLPAYFSILIALAAVFFYPIIFNPLIHDLLLIVSIAGVGVYFGGAVNPGTAMIIMLVLAVYDYIAVYRTRHMVTMFKNLVVQNVYFGLIVPYDLKKYLQKINKLEMRKDYVFLGTGDLVVPLIFAVSVYPQSIIASIFVAIGATAGMISLYVTYILNPERQAQAGLPPIVIGSLIGYGIVLLIR